LGKRREHVILAQHAFRYNDGLYDIDYTAVALPWATSSTIVEKRYVCSAEAQVLLNSFSINGKNKSEKTTFNAHGASGRYATIDRLRKESVDAENH
jgi:hypothetical protein